MKQRLAKFLAHAGIASRRKAEVLIQVGCVSVNGKTVTNVVTLVDPDKDRIEFEGKRIGREQLAYVAFHKPKGVASTLSDPHARNNLSQWIPKKLGRVYPVGRLDQDSTGLVLLTNDGEMANRLIHPRYKVWKIYLVEIAGPFNERDESRLEKGIQLEEGKTLPCRVEIQSIGKKSSRLRIELREGKKRQIRRMLGALGYNVKTLHRIAVGPIYLGPLKEGKWRILNLPEVAALKKAVSV